MERFKRAALLASLLILFSACEAELKTISKPVGIDLHINVETLRATKVYVNATPEVDKVWYFWDVIKCEEIDESPRSEEQFMDLVIDGEYVDYLSWRHDKLMEGVPFIGNFASHSLSYGPTNYYFTELEPDTDYYVYAFCVNSDNNKPMGDLKKVKFRTKPNPDPSYRNSMVIDFEMHENEVMVIPSKEGLEDYYIWDIVEADQLEAMKLNLEEYALQYVDYITKQGYLRSAMCRGIVKDYLALEGGKAYILIAGAYDANFEKALYVRHFVFQAGGGFYLERGHDEPVKEE